ncbi:DUF805 domain-containing protein [Sphingorhabdus arenilitoris]|uniref:DUF805 domain-containing protein n=1 Tax=Sphingorhabdus arenilitoris TaxID=1490041 RepID=A0ABV8RGI2_9SPHN
MMFALNPFAGRINRGDWWLLQLLIWVFAFAAMAMTIMFASDTAAPVNQRNGAEKMLLVLIILSVIYMNFASCLNRLRDTGRSGWLYLCFLLPTVGTGLMIYFYGIEQ